MDKMLTKLADEYPDLTGAALLLLAALLVWGFFRWLDKTS